MAELTALESKLGEVLGLAMAAQDATAKVGKLVEEEGHDDLSATLQRMAEEAKETEERTTELASELEGKKTAILEKARETKQEAVEMMSTYLGDDADALDGFEFLTMAEAGEVGHWSVVGTMSRRASVPGLQELVAWATPIQQRHFQQTLEGSVELAADEDPNEPA
jgi:coenzyme F420-reducing hydrogenase alpha subunit